MSSARRRLRVARASAHRLPPAIEAAYMRGLRAAFRAVGQAYANHVRILMAAHLDANTPLVAGVVDALKGFAVSAFAYLKKTAGKLWDAMVAAVLRRPPPIDSPTANVGLDALVARAKAANLAYVQKAAETQLEQIAEVLTAAPVDATMAQVLQVVTERNEVAESHAEFLAGDQTNKLDVDVLAAQMVNVGARQYVWVTMRDDRVRPTHAENDGKVFTWGVDAPNGTVRPGHEPGCRCKPVPYEAALVG